MIKQINDDSCENMCLNINLKMVSKVFSLDFLALKKTL